MDLASLKQILISLLAVLKNVGVAVVPIGGLILAILSARWAGRQWRSQHMTKEWGTLVQFLMNHTAYMDPVKNQDYKNKFQGEESLKYEIVARLCLSYLDDVYYLKLWHYHEDWLVGSVQFLAGTHREWLKDHEGAYSKEFYRDLTKALGSAPKP